MVEGGNNFFGQHRPELEMTTVPQGQQKKAEVHRWMINRLLTSSAADDHGLAMQEDLEETRGWQQKAGAWSRQVGGNGCWPHVIFPDHLALSSLPANDLTAVPWQHLGFKVHDPLLNSNNKVNTLGEERNLPRACPDPLIQTRQLAVLGRDNDFYIILRLWQIHTNIFHAYFCCLLMSQ